MAKIKATTDGKKGGLLGANKPHSRGGIKAVVVDEHNKPIEVESGEAIITKPALKDKTVKTLTGTNVEILNKINTEAGGNPIYAPSEVKMAKGGSITPSAISKMTRAEQKAFYKTKEGKELDKQTHAKWKSLVNMSKSELKAFYDSEEGKKAGLSASEAKAEGIDSGRESARWIMKMKDIPYTEWTSNMWRWAKKQISFVSRMKGMKGDLYDDKGNKTRKHLALLIWGHNPKKMAEGGNVGDDYNNEQETMIDEPLMFEEGGVVPSDKTPEELAKDFVNSLPQDVIQEMKDKYNALIAEMVVKEKNTLDAINNEIAELEAKKEALSGDRSDDAFKKRSDYYTAIRQKQNGLRHQTNRYYAMKNGGSLATFTDKKGVEHKDIPDFTSIGSEDISFDEENILTQTPPQYIPIISEDSFREKGYLFDAIRYSSDTYIIAVNGYRETLLKGFEYTTEHPSDAEQGYALVTLDQLILINDYYYTKAKATERKNAEETNKRTEERWDRMPREDRERYYASKYFYESMPVSVKKKVTKDAWDLLTLEQKEGFYKPIKIVQGKRLVSKLDDDKMWASFHNMYERFLNPEVKIRIEKGVRYGHPEVFEYWFAFRDMMKWKLKDIKFQRQFLSDIRKTALETSFGMSNTNDTLYDRLGILVKRQNGSSIKPLEIEQISAGWYNVNKVYGGLVSLAKEEAMKISHTGNTLVFASKFAGVYIPTMKTIAVSAKYGDAMFESILAHEVAHWIDNKIGEQNRLRWATDNYESTAGMIASTFRKRMNVKSESDYINATKECFARALEQFFAISVFGENATVFPDPLHPDLSMSYFQSPNYVNKAVYESTMKPLIEKFFQENKDFFKYGIETNVADANFSKEVAPITTPMEVKPEVVMTEEERLRKEFDDLAKADTMTDAQKATIQRIADNLADKLKGIELPAKTETPSEEKEDESMSKENLLASLEGAKVAVEFLEGQQKQDMVDYIEGLETLIEIL